jgi:hypothetical protein
VEVFGRGRWSNMSNVILSKSPSQIRSHAYKFFRRKTCQRVNFSINDIELSLPEKKTQLSNHELTSFQSKHRSSKMNTHSFLPSEQQPCDPLSWEDEDSFSEDEDQGNEDKGSLQLSGIDLQEVQQTNTTEEEPRPHFPEYMLDFWMEEIINI